MKIVLLSGGSGKRLWPLSNDIRSKQFLKVVQNGAGEAESMLQRVYRQMKEAGLDADITVATSATQVESIRGQLGNKVSVVVEPERRNTFPAIVLSAAYLYFEKNCPMEETMVVLPVDPYVGEEYFKMLKCLDIAVQDGVADIVLMGVRPTYPSEKYGYIIPAKLGGNLGQGITTHGDLDNGEGKERILPVVEFKEKPDIYMAQELIDKGGLWNCGVFAFRLSYLMGIVQAILGCGCYADVERQYGKLERTSFDYAVVEKAGSVAVAAYNGEWKDLGTWNTLTEVMEEKPIGDVAVSGDCVNTHVINELEIPVVVMGAKDMVVAASPDGILVADKVQSSYIKKYVEDRDLRPMFEERSWGEYTVLNISVDGGGNRAVTKKKLVQAGRKIEETRHQHHLEVWTVLSGRAVISVRGRRHEALAGDTFTIGRGVAHSLQAEEDVVLLEVQIEEDRD
ncbi:MAG: cupin domain-containing protein [Lachnospiraceae bacterium]|nr:cupin domain-containing protein [Lachnospiraceae bacterium]